MPEPSLSEEHIQSLADVLSLVAIVGQIDKAAIQRVLVTLGAALLDVDGRLTVDRQLAGKLLIEIARESGEEAAMQIASDLNFVARAWQPVLDEYLSIDDPYRLLPFAEIVYALINYSGSTLQDYGVFERFGGPDVVLSMPQLSAALSTYAIPKTGLAWELVGFQDPPDQALVASDAENIFLFKAASSGIDLRFSELERGSQEQARREHDVRVDTPLYAAIVAGLLGDMLYWAARLRAHALPGHELWRRIRTLLLTPGEAEKKPPPPAAAPPGDSSPGADPGTQAPDKPAGSA